MRFFVAMFAQETNTFSTIRTDGRRFEARDLGDRDTGTGPGGMIDGADADGSAAGADTPAAPPERAR